MGRFLAVVGPSGSGKSSVVKAGLLPAIRRGAVPGSDQWFVVEMLPGAHPLEELEIGLLRIAAHQHGGLMEQLKRDARGLVRAARLVLPSDDSHLLLIVDQFEELFTLVQDKAEATHFMDSLAAAISDPRSRVRIIITLRADFYDRPLTHPEFSTLMGKRTQVVTPLTTDELARAIAGPAERVGAVLEPGLVTDIIADVKDQAGALPLLQYALTELFERREGHLLTRQAYKSIGGVMGALGRRADVRMLRLLAGETAEWQNAKRDASFLLTGARLAQFEGWAAETKLAFTQDERAFLDASLAERQKREAEEAARQRCELETAQTLAEAQRQRAKTEKHRAEEQTRAAGQLRQRAIGLAGALVIAAMLAIVALIASQRATQSAATAQAEARTCATAEAVAKAEANVRATAGASAVQERQNALRQAAILLAQQSENEVQYGNPDRAVLLALEVLVNYPYTAQAERALGQAVTLGRAERFLAGHISTVGRVAWSPDGKQVATASTDRTVRIWDAATGREVHRLEVNNQAYTVAWSPDGNSLMYTTGDRFLAYRGDQGVLGPGPKQGGAGIGRHTDLVYSVAWSLDGQRLLTAGQDQTARIWDAANGRLLQTLSGGHTQAVTAAVFSPDGARVATSAQDGLAVIWDATTVQNLLQITVDTKRVWDVAWSPDGKRLATANESAVVQVWDTATGQALFALRGHEGRVVSVAWSADGRRILTGGGTWLEMGVMDGVVREWDVETGKQFDRMVAGGGSHLHWRRQPGERWN